MEFIPLLVIALLFWFLVLQPQRRRSRQQAAVRDALEPGQEVVTAGGLIGRVRAVEGGETLLEVAENTVVRIDKRAVTGRVEARPDAPDPG
ncbi:MAG TPA: preprotein translocase subunit YajC [Gaiellaceae bacterium]|jgi:preprotein translocase subunit YajC|nr:preprotein translocase subunit YajC [Gaiellaceae bacterium]